MDINYHIGHLTDHFNSNDKIGQIDFHIRAIVHKYKTGKLQVDPSNRNIFKKIVSGLMKYDNGYWDKENEDYKILFYALKGLLNIN